MDRKTERLCFPPAGQAKKPRAKDLLRVLAGSPARVRVERQGGVKLDRRQCNAHLLSCRWSASPLWYDASAARWDWWISFLIWFRTSQALIFIDLMISTSSLQATNSFFNSVAGNQFNVGNNANVTVNNLPPSGVPELLYFLYWHLTPKSLTEYVPPRRVNDAPMDLLASNFTGRTTELDFLLQAFDMQDILTEEDVPTRCAVHGMPGLGKTQLILRFAQIAFARQLYSHIMWMSAASPDKLVGGMAKILDLVGHPERTRSDQKGKLTAARLWLEDSQLIDGVRWLLIVDNVDKSALEFLREHLPRRNAKGNLLFTTRASDIAGALIRVTGGRHSKLELRVPDLVETTDLLFSSAGIDASMVTPIQRNQAERLVQNLGSLPLAVVQAASYMEQTVMTLESMLKISEGEGKIGACLQT
jgi:hypothetical protein